PLKISSDDISDHQKNGEDFEEDQSERKEIVKLIQSNKTAEKEIRAYCAKVDTCQAYITLYKNNKTFGVGKNSVNLYAQKSQNNLLVFDKQPDNKLPVFILDKNTSYSAANAKDTIHI